MIDYQLAKELMDAGFPQKRNGMFAFSSFERLPDGVLRTGEQAYVPTLSELIGACGDDFTILESWGSGFNAYQERQDLIGKVGEGSTPEEAVARLWLALNRKEA